MPNCRRCAELEERLAAAEAARGKEVTCDKCPFGVQERAALAERLAAAEITAKGMAKVADREKAQRLAAEAALRQIVDACDNCTSRADVVEIAVAYLNGKAGPKCEPCDIERKLQAAEAALALEQERNRNNVANADMEIRDLRAALEQAREALKACPPLHTDSPRWLRFYQLANAALSPSQPAPVTVECGFTLKELGDSLRPPSPPSAPEKCGHTYVHSKTHCDRCGQRCGKPAKGE